VLAFHSLGKGATRHLFVLLRNPWLFFFVNPLGRNCGSR
jgi:hypothetical protein